MIHKEGRYKLMQMFERYCGIIDDWPRFIATCRRPLPTCVWANSKRISPQALAARFRAKGLAVVPVAWHPAAFKLPPEVRIGHTFEYHAGLCHLQEEVAMLPAMLLDARPGETILDLCAAPGNKSAQIALRLSDSGTVFANDAHAGRLRAINRMVDRLGLLNISVTNFDATSFPRQPFLFDRVVADVPCSCEGTCRKNPEVLTDANLRMDKLITIQEAILKRALQLCKPGGRVVYATCTFAPEENEMVVEAVLRELQPQITAQIAKLTVPDFTCSPGLSEWQGQRFRDDMPHAIRIYPHQNDTGGFFIAVIDKLEDRRPAERQVIASAAQEHPEETGQSVAAEFFATLQARFGIPVETFNGFHLTRYNTKSLSLVPDETPRLIGMKRIFPGLPFVKLKMKFPKLTTPAAMGFGRLARKHIVDLNPEQADAYFRNQTFILQAHKVTGFESDGYCIVRCEGFPLGLGLLFREGDAFRLKSTYPKAWQLPEHKSAFRV